LDPTITLSTPLSCPRRSGRSLCTDPLNHSSWVSFAHQVRILTGTTTLIDSTTPVGYGENVVDRGGCTSAGMRTVLPFLCRSSTPLHLSSGTRVLQRTAQGIHNIRTLIRQDRLAWLSLPRHTATRQDFMAIIRVSEDGAQVMVAQDGSRFGESPTILRLSRR